MKHSESTQEQLTSEMARLRQRIAELEGREAHPDSAQETLCESETMYRTLVEGSLEGVVIAQGLPPRLVFASAALATMLGYTVDGLLSLSSKDVAALIYSEDQELFLGRYRDRLEGKPTAPRYEFRAVRQDGTLRWLEILSTRIDYRGQPAVHAAFLDITERKDAEEELKSERDKLQALAEGLARTEIGIDIVGANFEVEFQNRVLEERFGAPGGRRCYEHFMEREQPCDPCPMLRAIEGHRLENSELIGADGRHYRLLSAPLPSPGGTLDRAIEVIVDITERKEAEEALRESEAMLRSIFRASPIGISVARDRVVLWTNERMCQMFGYSSEEVVGQSTRMFYRSDEEYGRVGKLLHEQIVEHGAATVETRLNRKDGSQIDVLLNAAVLDSSKSPADILFALSDITERKKTEDVLRSMTEVVAATTGEGFFRSLAQYLAGTLDIDYALIGELVPGEIESVKTLAVCAHGEIVDNFTYELAGTPCENVMGKRVCFYASDVQQQFPLDHLLTEMGVEGYVGSPLFDSAGGRLGIIAVLDGKPLGNPKLFETVLQICGVRASAELERSRAEAALRESEEKFRNIVEASPLGMHMYKLEADGRLVFTGANPAADSILGVDNQQFVGMTLEEAFPALADSDVPVMYRRAAASATPWRTEQIAYEDNRISGAFQVDAFQTSPGRMVATFLDITERKQAEERLRESEEKYRELVDNSSDLIYSVDLEGRNTFANPRTREFLGCEPEEVVGRDFAEYVHPDDVLYLSASIRRLLQEEPHESDAGLPAAEGAEFRFVKKDGEVIWVTSRDSPIRDGEGRLVGFSGVVRDVTARRRAENLVRAERDLGVLLGVASGLPEALRLCLEKAIEISEMDCGGVYLVDRSSGDLDIAVHQGLSAEFVASAAHYEADSANARVVMSGFPVCARYEDVARRLSRVDRREGLRALAVVPIRHENEVIGCFNIASHTFDDVPGFSRDALEVVAAQAGSAIARLGAEEALRTSEERYREVVENANDAIFVTQDGMVKFFNSRATEMTGYNADELTSRPFVEQIHPDDRDMVIDHHLRRLAGEDVPPTYTFKAVHRDGGILWQAISSVVIDWEGRPAVLSFIADITERTILEQKMFEYQELDKLKSDLLSTVSHELRTPLAAIKGYSTLILGYEDRLGVDEKHDYLRSIDQATDRLTELVDHLLDMSRLDAGLLRLEKAPTSIVSIIDQAVSEARLRAPGHTIESSVAEELPDANLDGKRARQVLDNLLDNACKYAEKGTRVVVSARRDGEELVIGVADEGMGIPVADLEMVFDRMYRIEHRLTATIGGVGLGLAICKGLVEAHGGRIWVESEEGSGSVFYCTFPLRDLSEVSGHG